MSRASTQAPPAPSLVAGTGVEPKRLADAMATIEQHLRTIPVRSPNSYISGSNAAAKWITAKLGKMHEEYFAVMYLDTRGRLIEFRTEYRGTVDWAKVHLRGILRSVMETNAARVIFAHNHPSGVAEPSVGDIHLTDHLTASLHAIECEVLDHIVVAGGDWVSMAERGMIAEYKPDH